MVDPQTDFFSIGGDSIFSIQLAAELHKNGFAVAVADIFKHPTLEELAGFCDGCARLERQAPQHERNAPFALVPAADREKLADDLEDAYPLTSLQLGMLFHRDMEQGSAVYHDVFAYDLELEYDGAAFHDAIQRVTDRHPVLRTGFDLRSYSIPLQLVQRQLNARISASDLSGLPEEQQDEAIRAAIERLKHEVFDRSCPGLIRFTILQRHERRIHFIVSADHAILDGWSMATLKRQIFEQYRNLTRGVALSSVFDSGSLCFADYVALEARDADDAASRAFWQAYCASCGNGSIPGLPALPGDARVLSASLDPTLVEQLAGVSKREGVGLKILLLLAHAHMLRSIVGEERVTTAVTDNARPEVEGAENVAGLFLNVLPFHMTFAGRTWRQLSGAAQVDDVDRKPYRRFPLARIASDNRGLQVESLFTYNNFHVADVVKSSDALKVLAAENFSYTNFKFSTLAHGSFQSGVTVVLTVRMGLTQQQMRALLLEFVAALRLIASGYDDPVPQRLAQPLPCFATRRYCHLRYRGPAVRPAPGDCSNATEVAALLSGWPSGKGPGGSAVVVG